MRRLMLAVTLGAMSAASAGCLGRLGREGAGLVLGASHSLAVIQPLPAGPALGPARVEPITSDMDQAVMGTWLTTLTEQASAKLMADPDLAGGTRPVTVSGKVVHLEGAGLVGQALGPDSEVVIRVLVRDSSGTVIGQANVVGRARGSLRSGEEALAEAFAKGLAKWLKANNR